MTTWLAARGLAAAAAGPLPPQPRSLADALGCVLAEPMVALTDLPAADRSAMDGYAVCGPGPWTLIGSVLAGGTGPRLATGTCVEVATGAELPAGAEAVLRHEDADLEGPVVRGTAAPGRDIRLRGEECTQGTVLLPAGAVLTPAGIGLAAAVGHDRLVVRPRPVVDVLISGSELVDSGVPRDGRVRDSIGPMLPSWLHEYGAEVGCQLRLPDDLATLRAALSAAQADLVITTGATAAGPADYLRAALTELGAQWLVAAVAVRPGHPMFLAQLPDQRLVAGLPGNPFAAVAGLCTLVEPVLRSMRGLSPATPSTGTLGCAVEAPAEATRLAPVRRVGTEVHPLTAASGSMLRGLAAADALAVIPPGGCTAGATVQLLGVPGLSL